MLDQQHGRIGLLVQATQLPDQLISGDRVELRGGLVEQDQRGACDQRARERDALELAAGELGGVAIEQVRDAERERGFLDGAGGRRRALAAALERERELGAHAAHHDLRLGVLQQRAGVQRDLGGRVLARVEPGYGDASGEAPPWKCGTRPAAARSSVDLPEPEGPASTQNSPGSSARLTSHSAGAGACG